MGSNLWRDALQRRLISNKLSLFGSIYILIIIFLALITPFIYPYDYAYQNLELGPSPSPEHWLGTDTLGRDLLTRMMYGMGFFNGRLLATMVALTIGVTWGTVAGFAGGKTDTIMMRIVDVLYGIPFIIFVILLMVIFGRNLILLFMAIGAVEWLTMARIVKIKVMSLSKQVYIGGRSHGSK